MLPDGDDGHVAETWPSVSGGRSGGPAGNCPFRFLQPRDKRCPHQYHMMMLTLRRLIKLGGVWTALHASKLFWISAWSVIKHINY